MPDETPTTWMTLKEVMAALECSRKVVLHHVTDGEIRSRRTLARGKYHREDVERLAREQLAPSS